MNFPKIAPSMIGSVPESLPAPASEVQDQIDTLQKALANLEHVCEQLDERLGPVYRRVAFDSPAGERKDPGALSAIAVQIRDAADHADHIALRVQQAIDLLAI